MSTVLSATFLAGLLRGGRDAGAGAAAGPAASRRPGSFVAQAMAQARRTMTYAFAAACLVLVVVVGERAWFSAQQQAVSVRQADVLRVAGELRLMDARITTAARLAVLTGDTTWVSRFDELHPRLEALFDQARALAPPEVSARFDADSRSATVELTDMREAAFEAVSVGAADVARSVFDGDRYRHQTALFDQAITRFIDETVQAADARIAAVRRHTATIGSCLLFGLLAFGWWLHGRLARVRDGLVQAEERVERLALTDPLTELPNRTGLHEAMTDALDRAQREGGSVAVLTIDLDRFKAVCDRHGHATGDRVLQEVARRLTSVIRPGEFCARLGGDEFVVLVPGSAGAADRVPAVADGIRDVMAQPVAVGPLALSLGATVGIACFPEDGRQDDELMRRAESALHRAKATHRGSAVRYDRRLDERLAERTQREAEIRDGLSRGEFVAYLQPIVDLATRRVQSVEVLARWQHPQRGLVPPVDFIALAEETGLIQPMTLAVLHSACRQLSRLPAHWRMSLNVAPQQMQDELLPARLSAVLAEHGIDGSRLDVELTETALVQDTDVARRVTQALKDAGFTVTLDDFGTGYSSLSYLAELAFDRIKIDRSFVRTLHSRPQSAQIVGAMIGLSRSLGMQTVAEGIETEEDARRLLAMGCPLGQGYWFGRPATADGLLAHLHATSTVDCLQP